MVQVLVFGVMLSCAALPFMLLTVLMRRGKSGLALTIGSLIGAGLVILIFASGTPIGFDAVMAMAVALVGFVPAFLGTVSGALLGFLLRRQDERRIER
ncbi:MAG: UDP-N-acetylmuramate--alanine ligase [Pseudomonadota bacterium]